MCAAGSGGGEARAWPYTSNAWLFTLALSAPPPAAPAAPAAGSAPAPGGCCGGGRAPRPARAGLPAPRGGGGTRRWDAIVGSSASSVVADR